MPTSSFIELIHVDPTATVAESLKNAPAAAQAAIKNALDANLKTQLKAMLTSTPVLAGLVENMAGRICRGEGPHCPDVRQTAA